MLLILDWPQLSFRFQSFFSGLYFWKISWNLRLLKWQLVSILLLWIVLLKDCKNIGIAMLIVGFNPSSLDCTSERPPCEGMELALHWFQSFFSGLYFWKQLWGIGYLGRLGVSILLLWIVLLKGLIAVSCWPPISSFNPSSLDCTSESYCLCWSIIVSLCFNPSSLDCTSERDHSFGFSTQPYGSFNPSSLDCTSESLFLAHKSTTHKLFQSFFSGLYFWKFT